MRFGYKKKKKQRYNGSHFQGEQGAVSAPTTTPPFPQQQAPGTGSIKMWCQSRVGDNQGGCEHPQATVIERGVTGPPPPHLPPSRARCSNMMPMYRNHNKNNFGKTLAQRGGREGCRRKGRGNCDVPGPRTRGLGRDWRQEPLQLCHCPCVAIIGSDRHTLQLVRGHLHGAAGERSATHTIL